MATTKKRPNFFDTAEGHQTAALLRSLVADSGYNTVSSYSADSIRYPNNIISFVDKHMKYLSEHQDVNIDHYLANLRLMTRIR